MKLIAMLRERDLVRQPDEPASAGLTTAAVLAASNERAQACNTTQWLKARTEQVGGVSVSSRERVVGCPVMLTTVGTELSSHVASDSPEASDRAVIQTARSHRV